MALRQDILAELAEIAPGSALASARDTRDAATRHAQGSYDALFSAENADFPADERFIVAAKVAKWHNANDLAAHYASFGLADPTSARLSPALDFARLLTFSPVKATPDALKSLVSAGWNKQSIVTLAQLIAFVSFQSRLLVGLRLLNGKPATASESAVVAGAGIPHRVPRAVKSHRWPLPSKSWAGSRGSRRNRWRNLRRTNRRFWQSSAIPIRTIFAC